MRCGSTAMLVPWSGRRAVASAFLRVVRRGFCSDGGGLQCPCPCPCPGTKSQAKQSLIVPGQHLHYLRHAQTRIQVGMYTRKWWTGTYMPCLQKPDHWYRHGKLEPPSFCCGQAQVPNPLHCMSTGQSDGGASPARLTLAHRRHVCCGFWPQVPVRMIIYNNYNIYIYIYIFFFFWNIYRY